MIYDELPLFEDIRPIGTVAALSGKIGRRTRPLHIGDEVVLVIECEVTGVGHDQGKGGVARVHKLSIVDGYELGGDRAPDLVTTLAAEYADAMGETGDPTLFDGADDLPEYDVEEHGDPEPGDCYLVDGVASRWDEIEEPTDVRPAAFGWVDLDAYAGSSSGFGFSERERVREYRSGEGEEVEAILVTKASAATAGEWIRDRTDNLALPSFDADAGELSYLPVFVSAGPEGEPVAQPPADDAGRRVVVYGEYLAFEGGTFEPYADEVFVDLFPTLITEPEPTTEEVDADDDAEGPAEE